MIGLVAAPDFKPSIGGVAEHAHQMMKHLTELGEEVVVVAPEMRGASEFDRSCPYSVRRFPSASGATFRSRLDRIRLWRSTIEAAEAVRPDYLLCSRWDVISGSIVALVSRVLGLPLLMFAHGTEVSRHSWWTPVLGATLRNADRVVCVSSYTRSAVEALGVDPSRVVVVPNGIDIRTVDRYRQQRAAGRRAPLDTVFRTDRPTVLTISRLTPRKGIDRVIAAMPTVVSAVPDAVYVVGGDGPDRERLEQLRDESPARDAIRFLGPVTEDEKLECYEQCDVFAMPNRNEKGDVEGFGIVFLEANAFGKPVIGGRSGGAVDAIVDGKTGLLVDPNNVDLIAGAVIRLLTDSDESGRLGANGKTRVESDLSWSSCAKELRSVIVDVVE